MENVDLVGLQIVVDAVSGVLSLRNFDKHVENTVTKAKAAFKDAGGASKFFETKIEGVLAAAKRLDPVFSKITTSMAAIAATAAVAGAALVGSIATGLIAIGKASISAAANMETMRNRLIAVIGSTKEADEELKRLETFTLQTPFELNDLIEATTLLRGIGVEGKEALVAVGNAAAAMQRPIMDAVIGVVSLEREVLRRWGVDLRQVAGKFVVEYKNSMGEIKKVTADSFDDARQMIMKVFLDKWPNAMKQMEGSWSALVSNLKDSWNFFLVAVGNSGPLEAAKAALKAVFDTFMKFRESGKLEETARSLGLVIVQIMGAFASVAAAGIRALGALVSAAETAFSKIKQGLNVLDAAFSIRAKVAAANAEQNLREALNRQLESTPSAKSSVLKVMGAETVAEANAIAVKVKAEMDKAFPGAQGAQKNLLDNMKLAVEVAVQIREKMDEQAIIQEQLRRGEVSYNEEAARHKQFQDAAATVQKDINLLLDQTVAAMKAAGKETKKVEDSTENIKKNLKKANEEIEGMAKTWKEKFGGATATMFSGVGDDVRPEIPKPEGLQPSQNMRVDASTDPFAKSREQADLERMLKILSGDDELHQKQLELEKGFQLALLAMRLAYAIDGTKAKNDAELALFDERTAQEKAKLEAAGMDTTNFVKGAVEERTNIEKAGTEATRIADKAAADAKLSQQADIVASIGAAVSTVFGKSKAGAIAATIINTAAAIMQAMAQVPYPANIAVAAAAGITGLAQIAKIKSTNIGSSGGGGGSSAPSVNYSGAANTPSGASRGQTGTTPVLVGGSSRTAGNEDMKAKPSTIQHITIQAIDSKSFSEYVQRPDNRRALADAANKESARR